MKKLMMFALCAVLMLAATGCSVFESDVSNIEIQFGWAEDDSPTAINGYTCVGGYWTFVEAFQTTFEPIAEYHSWTTAGGSLYTDPMESKKAEKYVKKYADQAIALAKKNAAADGYSMLDTDVFRVVYSYGASSKKTKVLNYNAK